MTLGTIRFVHTADWQIGKPYVSVEEAHNRALLQQERVEVILRIGALARQLQVIVLTCNPSDYVALGARQTLISPTTVAASSSPAVEAGGSGDDEEVADSSVSEEEKQEFLTTLENAGGSAGNQSLREALGWSESTYMAVKQALLDAGEIATGRGRGGSVSLSSFAGSRNN